jgi:two-component system, response regulator PdtaR
MSAGSARHVAQAMTSKGNILVVDDDRLVLATVTHGLGQAGYHVIDADNGDDAILLARQHKPDLALLDIRMEGKSGFDVAAYLRDASRIPFMFLSAFSDAETVSRAEGLGAVGYLVKPLDVSQIVPIVDEVMARVRGGVPAAAPLTPVSATAPATTPATPPSARAAAVRPAAAIDAVSLAVGIVMHRYSLGRGDALARLERLALEQGVSLETQAERLVGAVEELARTAQ